MDGGIAIPSGGNNVIDPDLRLEIYRDWVSLRQEDENYDPEFFAKCKGITNEDLESIVREFKSYDPKGERWGKIK